MAKGMPGKPPIGKVMIHRTKELDPNFRWRDQHGRVLKPAEMDTDHLVNAIKMVWNNFMPRNMRVGPVKLYDFRYSLEGKQHFMTATLNFYAELKNRQLTPWQAEWLNEMAANFKAFVQLEGG